MLVLVQHVPTHIVHTQPSSAHDNMNDSINNAQYQTLNHALQEEFIPALFGEAIDDNDYRLELPVNYSGLALPQLSQFRNAESTSEQRRLQPSHRCTNR